MVTELRTLLDEVEALGREEQQFAQHLRELVRGYDMDGVLNALSQLQSEEGEES